MLLFFIPGAKAVSQDLLRAHGLDILEGRTAARETYRGPGGAGLLVADNALPAELLNYEPNKQRWSERFGFTSQVGTWLDKPVRPADVARPVTIVGPALELLDGQRWTVPLMRQWREVDGQVVPQCMVPCVMRQSMQSGQWVLGDVVPEYRQLWDTSLDIAQQILNEMAGESKGLDDQLFNQFVIDLLRVNYRVDASVVSHLQLLTPALAGRIVCAALDVDTLRNHLKNLAGRQMSGGMSTESGATQPTADASIRTAPRRRK